MPCATPCVSQCLSFSNYLCSESFLFAPMSLVQEFNDYRARMNERILSHDNKVIKRFWSLDHQAYQEGALDSKTKELLGLVASMVLRCDDCVRYHLGQCYQLGVSTDEVFEVFAIANLVGGSICIPHTRRAVEYWDALCASSPA